MFQKTNILEILTLSFSFVTVFIITWNFFTDVSPISGIRFPIYCAFLFLVSIYCSFKIIRSLLHLNKPIKYDRLAKLFPRLGPYLKSQLPKSYQSRTNGEKSAEFKEYDTNELSVISTVLEKMLVSSWYVPYISQEIGFPFACKQLLDQMIGKAFKITHKIESKEVHMDICSILISHLKEYNRALKRHEKQPEITVEKLYKKSHPIHEENSKITSGDHCTNVLRLIMKELVPWELWETPYSELLVRILSKKLDSYIDSTIANPQWLNLQLLYLLAESDTEKCEGECKCTCNKKSEESDKSEHDKNEHEQDKNEHEHKEIGNSVTEANENVELNEHIKVNDSQIEEIEHVEEVTNGIDISIDSQTESFNGVVEEIKGIGELKASDPLDIQSSPVMRQRRGRQGKNEVKIYDRIIEGSVKTWESEVDLQCISVGQDLLASLDALALSRLWAPDGSPEPARKTHADLRMQGEEEDTWQPESPHKENKSPKTASHSPKATDILLKDLQSTVHQAKNKIGDLQVDRLHNDIDVASSLSGDEAAGMMEGLLDFGIAGLKKGLRFTGLSDDLQDKEKVSSVDRASPVAEFNPIFSESRDDDVIAEENGSMNGSAAPPLQKQQRVASQDSVAAGAVGVAGEPGVAASSSPEPQYEEVTDLSTSIAKLRHLLQARSDDSIWWEGAEETRGHTQQHHSSRPVDPATLADEYDMNAERNPSPGHGTNNTRLDKLFQRTVTGVFNSLRTAVGAEQAAAPGAAAQQWTYIPTAVDMSTGGAVARLVWARRAHAHVDAALDSLHVDAGAERTRHVHDDDDEWCNVAGSYTPLAVEVLCALGLFHSHVARRIVVLLTYELAEPVLSSWLEDLSSWLRKQIFTSFEQLAAETRRTNPLEDTFKEYDLEDTCALIMDMIPVPPIMAFGYETLESAISTTLESFNHRQITKDVAFRLLDVLALHFKNAAALPSDSFDN